MPKPSPADIPDAEWYPPWHARIRKSRSKSQSVQNRVLARFFAACRARDAVLLARRAEEERARERSERAAWMRRYRARNKELRAGQ